MAQDNKPFVLIIEDEALLREAIQGKLEQAGFATTALSSAEEAISYLETAAELPDGIWLDYYLSGMDGLEFMQKIRQNPKLADLPAIVVSNSASEVKVKNMLALGSSKYILKANHRLEEIVDLAKEFIESERKKV